MAGVKKWGPMLGETRKLLLRLAAERGLHSGRALAHELEITPQSVSLLLKGKRVMSSETAVRVCDLLGLDHGDVLKRLHAERDARAKRPARDARTRPAEAPRIVWQSAPRRERTRARQATLI